MNTKLQITGKLHYHRKCDFQLSKRKLGYRTLLPLTAPIRPHAALFLGITLANVDRFQNLFHCWILQ